jgi:subtilase family serine protease
VRYRLAFFPALLILLLVGSFFLPSRFLPAAHAHRLFDPMDVGGVSPLVKLSRVTDHKSSSGTLQMSVGLALRHQDQLNTLLNKLYDPASPSYRQYLSVEQFTEQFGPTQEQQQAVINYLTQQGFTITGTYPNRLMIDFSGPQSLAEQVFNVKINTYEGPAGQTFFANASAPTLPAYIASYVTMISGLDDANSLYHPPLIAPHAPTLDPNAGNCPAPGQGGGGGGIFGGSQVAYIPSQFAKAYNYDGLHNAGLQGEGQTVGVFELDGYSLSDVQAYTQCFGGSNVPIQNVILDGFNGQPGAGAIEVELDMEVIMSMAPRLAKLIVYEAPNTTQGYNDEWAKIVSDRTPVVSVSWGDCETNMGQQEAQQENTFFQEAAAQGQTILVAAGDSGSESCWQQNYNPALVADDPATQPYVTGVGGTTLTLNSDNSRASESVWNGGFLGGAGGGGLSQYWKQPGWQAGPGTSGSFANGMRQTPDVSLDADPATGYPVYCTAGSSCNGSSGLGGAGGWLTVGGTSAAAPMWAAMIALANQQAAKAGKGHLGFLNPLLYKLSSGAGYKADFHDVTPPSDPNTPSNNDELGFNSGAYPVANGYDMATGWGTFDTTKLAADLVAMAK